MKYKLDLELPFWLNCLSKGNYYNLSMRTHVSRLLVKSAINYTPVITHYVAKSRIFDSRGEREVITNTRELKIWMYKKVIIKKSNMPTTILTKEFFFFFVQSLLVGFIAF